MCDFPNREEAMTVIRRNDNGEPTVWCDPCLAPLVEALQPIGTIASCCGHGKQPGSVVLADGRELMILPDFESARRAERLVEGD
jgi:hypothetical protein